MLGSYKTEPSALPAPHPTFFRSQDRLGLARHELRLHRRLAELAAALRLLLGLVFARGKVAVMCSFFWCFRFGVWCSGWSSLQAPASSASSGHGAAAGFTVAAGFLFFSLPDSISSVHFESDGSH
jgi:hypothetical protein